VAEQVGHRIVGDDGERASRRNPPDALFERFHWRIAPDAYAPTIFVQTFDESNALLPAKCDDLSPKALDHNVRIWLIFTHERFREFWRWSTPAWSGNSAR